MVLSQGKHPRGWLLARDGVTTSIENAAKGEYRVHCADCGHRLFDVIEKRNVRGRVLRYVVEAKCGYCKRQHTRPVTAYPGEALGESDRWLCKCNTFLARIEAVRGRLTVHCRCQKDVRVTVAEAVQVARDNEQQQNNLHTLPVGGDVTENQCA
jgi:hypothetical protein